MKCLNCMLKVEYTKNIGKIVDSRWDVTDAYCKDMLIAWNGSLSEKIRTCLDIFDLPAALVFSLKIHCMCKAKNNYKIFRHLQES